MLLERFGIEGGDSCWCGSLAVVFSYDSKVEFGFGLVEIPVILLFVILAVK